VEVAQRDVMLAKLKYEGWTDEDESTRTRVVEIKDLKYGHDEIWQDGVQIAEMIKDVIEKLYGS